MEKLALAILLVSTPAMAQSNPVPGQKLVSGWDGKVRCKPIGKTLSGELVFAVNCKDVPTGSTVKGQPPMAPESGIVR
jgi:hypothetical protein